MIVPTHRVHNFNAGPGVLPLEALERARNEWFDFGGTGMSVMEMSHRSKEFLALHAEAQRLLRELMEIPDSHQILLLQGGASLQFDMVPRNLLREGEVADYVVTGSWAEKALEEGRRHGAAREVWAARDSNFDHVPQQGDVLSFDPAARYVHITSNNTIHGTQWRHFPETGEVPLIADMSSDILSRPIDVSRFGLIYAGAQKNLGPSGLTLVIIRDDVLERCAKNLGPMLSYRNHVKNDSLYNTPPTFAIYMLRNVLQWVKDLGGVPSIAARNERKAELLYEVIDAFPELYRGHARSDSRSQMNVTWTMPDEALEKRFLAAAQDRDLIGLKGHRSVGGFRASIYNAMPLMGVRALVDHMRSFAERNG